MSARVSDWRGHGWIALPARLYLGAVFLIACWHKLSDPHAFALDVATYEILPLAMVNLTALVLPWVELGAGLMLVTGVRSRAGALLAAAMMVVFLAALSTALARGLDLSCGCFASNGAEADPISWKTLARDGVWLAIAVYVLAFDRSPLGLERLWSRVHPARVNPA